jgi:hypothetical protein
MIRTRMKMKMTTQTTMHKAIEDHADAVRLWQEVSLIAARDYRSKLSDEQVNAYLLLPSLQDCCKEAYARIPVGCPGRPRHYLMT